MITLRLYDRNGGALLGLLAEPVSYELSQEFNEIGALRFEYPSDGVNAAEILELREVAVVNASGTEIKNGRFVITGISRDRSKSGSNITVTCRSILWRLETALAYPDGGVASGEVARYFDTVTAGHVMKTLIDDAKTRGALSGITYGFTATQDSNAVAWPDTLTQEYAARSSILSVFRSLADYGLCEIETQARAIRLTVLDGIGSDKTTGASPIVLRSGFNLTEAPEEVNADRIAGVALVEGDEGLILERTNADAVSAYGRLETSFTASGIVDPLDINPLADAYLENIASAARQLTVGLTLHDDAPQPFTDFNVGDYVYTATSAGLEKVRVRQVTISMSGGKLSATATLGDRIYEADIRANRRLAAITSGSVTLGAGTLPSTTPVVTPDTLAPDAPTGLTGTSTSYLDGALPRAKVTLTWTAPTTNADGTALTDLSGYEVSARRAAGDAWEALGVVASNTATLSQMQPAQSYQFTVVAIDQSNNRSAQATTFTLTTATETGFTATPSTPTVSSRLGTLSVAWNGLNSAGGAMPANFLYLQVHASTTNGFTPSASTIVGQMNGKDTVVLSNLTYSTTYYIKFVAVSTNGLLSSASAQASSSINPLVDTDLIAKTLSTWPFADGKVDTAALASGAVSAAKLLDGAVTTAKISAGAVGADQIAAGAIVAGKIAASAVTADKIEALAVTAGKIASNAITADKIDAGAITAAKIASDAIDGKTITGATIRTSSATARVEMTSSGLFVYDSGGTKTVSLNADGTASFKGTITATSGTFSGTVQASGGYIGSAADGWNFSSAGYLYNNDLTTILYPGGNSYALITSRAVVADNGYQARLGCVLDVGGSTISNSYWKMNARIIPNTDNAFSNGASSLRWSVIYAATSTINTSDERLKTDIKPSVLGLSFINALAPVSYKYVVGGNDYNKETGEVTPRPGNRTHFGLIAQQVKATLDAVAPGQDFGGWVLEDISDPDSEQGLRYESFISPLIKAVQELSSRLEALENRA